MWTRESCVSLRCGGLIICSINSKIRIILGAVLLTFLFSSVKIPGISRTVDGCTWTCESRRNPSNFSKMPLVSGFSFRNSYNFFLVILPSLYRETCVIYSPLYLGPFVSLDEFFLGCSFWLPLLTAFFFLFSSQTRHCGKTNHQLPRLVGKKLTTVHNHQCQTF